MTVGELIDLLSDYDPDKPVQIQTAPCWECSEWHDIGTVTHDLDGEDWEQGNTGRAYAHTVYVAEAT